PQNGRHGGCGLRHLAGRSDYATAESVSRLVGARGLAVPAVRIGPFRRGQSSRRDGRVEEEYECRAWTHRLQLSERLRNRKGARRQALARTWSACFGGTRHEP